jgi:hypothetical protein
VDEAWPGDVIGLFDTGNFKIGDTLTEGAKFNFRGIPAFSPELFRELVNHGPDEEQAIGQRASASSPTRAWRSSSPSNPATRRSWAAWANCSSR